MPDRHDLVILGLGSAGITAAQFAASLGLRVAAVERARYGGDCLWTGCVPSKTLLASAKAAHAVRSAERLGVAVDGVRVDHDAVWRRVREVQAGLAASTDDPARLSEQGVEVLWGAARLTSPTTVEVEGHGTLETRHVLVCTGSRPVLPDIPGLRESGALTSESFWDEPALPRSATIVGGGPIGLELAQALVRLDVSVTVLEARDRVLGGEEPELARTLVELLRAEGVALRTGVRVERVEAAPDGTRTVHGTTAEGVAERWTAEAVLVAAGRAANVEGLGLEALGVRIGEQGIEVDGGGRTAVRTVHAAGDVTGAPRFTHAAGVEAARVVRNIAFPGREKTGGVVPWVTFTDPELAHVGLTEAQAVAEHGRAAVRVRRRSLGESDRARTDGTPDGAVVLVTAKGRLVGGHVLAPAAGELVGELALAIGRREKLRDLASVVHAYPTIGLEIQQLAAEEAYERAGRLGWLVRGRVG